MTHARTFGAAALLAVLALGGCGTEKRGDNVDPDQVDSTAVPDVGVCRNLTPEDVGQSANATRTVDCADKHTAETYAAGTLPDEFEDADYQDESVGEFAYKTCTQKFEKFLGGDESLVLRTIVSWAWFRPSENAWDDGARWYRCDVIGGNATSEEYRPLPETAQGLLLGRPDDRWLICAAGATVADGEKVPCAQPHTWRAATTIKLGEPEDKYPGDEVVASRTKAFCANSIKAWLNYPARFEYAYTHFHEAEWQAGNRRSVCWAKTSD
ncbi:septum formation family protein [Nocardioides stalactiti]|uniref:septum formation family protein n=1 Tax=Nocardioides stalactiti TaxID=2755356 RepID=UPI001601578B|nr:septum formation family protein [Nocardioides stalactiti]